jgi:hypothetical protein
MRNTAQNTKGETMATALERIMADLELRGPCFDGGSAEKRLEIAQEWIDEGFDPDDAAEWMDQGFWDPATAEAARSLNILPRDVQGLCNDNITGSDDPVLEMCNGDLDVAAMAGR